MNKRIIVLGTAVICLAACSSQNKNMSKNKGDTELSPTTTTVTMNRSETGAPLKQTETEMVESIVTIEKLNQDTRQMQVRNFQGMRETYTIAPEVKRLHEIKTGDKVAVRYYRSLGFEVRPPTAEEIKNPRLVGAAVSKHDLDLPPGIHAGALSHTIVTVQQIDSAANTVTVKLPEGNTLTILARYPENLARVKVGDTVAVTYGEAMAVDVQPVS